MVLMGPLNAIVARRMKGLQIDQMKNKDRRNKMMDEILNGIKIIKLYAWEDSFKQKVNSIREKEIGALQKIAYLNAAMTFLWVFLFTFLKPFFRSISTKPFRILLELVHFCGLLLVNLLCLFCQYLKNEVSYLVYYFDAMWQ